MKISTDYFEIGEFRFVSEKMRRAMALGPVRDRAATVVDSSVSSPRHLVTLAVQLWHSIVGDDEGDVTPGALDEAARHQRAIAA